ncbi:NAD-dependent epimerase/dehydratase family protein [Streptococcus minor]|uniref:NAD-dependent epimerase/dehydratase family protein n=1 Tax=Streptococcus minor TaxID=229549 RepID=A0A3P1VDN0_9STRE|nr:NAD-dependent epimerase/dehydratase family protein [Streptococcus minor]RRD32261.1 NAD-dependent epimerase/dehydratase family protein [Streptococcus minor]
MRKFNKNKYFSSLSKIIDPQLSAISDKSVLITGANGLIGGSLLDFLMYLNQEHDANIRISVLVRSQLEKHDFFDYETLNVIVQSVTDSIDIENEVDYIFHAASNAHPKAYDLYPVETSLINVIGTNNILLLAKEKKSKVIFISSSEVYGELADGKSEHVEDDYGYIDILSPRACYSESKRMAETLISSYIKEYGVQGVSVRPAYIYGPRFSESNSRADVQFIKNCLNNEDIVMKSEGLQFRSYCYVLDCVMAILFIALKGENGQAYNVSSDTGNVQLVDFARAMANCANVNLKFELSGSVGGSPVMNSLLSNKKLKSLGWEEKFNFDDGVRDTLAILD